MSKLLSALALLAGIVLIGLGVYYWITPAGSLPAYIPGRIDGSSTIHLKHGIAAFLLGLAALAYAWFSSKKKPSAAVPLM